MHAQQNEQMQQMMEMFKSIMQANPKQDITNPPNQASPANPNKGRKLCPHCKWAQQLKCRKEIKLQHQQDDAAIDTEIQEALFNSGASCMLVQSGKGMQLMGPSD
ncbi:hypothetical protein ACHAW6_015472 [Cyclotella cf. meneghiniana]